MIDTAHVGFAFPSVTNPLSVRRLLAYTAGLGDLSAALFDDTHPDFMAHPALCTALEWPVVSHPDVMRTLVPEAADRLRAVHLIQDSTFHRPLKAGMSVVTGGQVSGIWRGSNGVRSACTLSSTDAAGQLLVSSRSVAVYRGVQAQGEDRPAAGFEAVAVPSSSPDETAELNLVMEPALPHRYTEGSGIWNPIHTERAVARAVGLPDIVVHGTATWALAGSALIRQWAPGRPWNLRRLRGRFGALVLPDTTLTLKARAWSEPQGLEVHFTVLTPQGETAIAEGYAQLTQEAHP